MAILPRRGLAFPVAPIAGLSVAAFILLLGLTVLRRDFPEAEPGWFSRPVAWLTLGPIAVVLYLVALGLRQSTEGMRLLVSVTGGTAAAAVGLLVAGLGEPGSTFPAGLAWPGSDIGRAGLWLLLLTLAPFIAAWAMDYRRSDPWYLAPMWLTGLAWLVPLAGALLMLREL